jgi:hypothetical protein
MRALVALLAITGTAYAGVTPTKPPTYSAVVWSCTLDKTGTRICEDKLPAGVKPCTNKNCWQQPHRAPIDPSCQPKQGETRICGEAKDN